MTVPPGPTTGVADVLGIPGVPLTGVAGAEGRVAVAFAGVTGAAVAARLAVAGTVVGDTCAAADGAVLGATRGAALGATLAGGEVGVLAAPPQAVTPRARAIRSAGKTDRRLRFTKSPSVRLMRDPRIGPDAMGHATTGAEVGGLTEG